MGLKMRQAPTEGLDIADYTGYVPIEICVIMTVLASAVVVLRWISKSCIMRRSWDFSDGVLIVAYIFFESLCALGISW